MRVFEIMATLAKPKWQSGRCTTFYGDVYNGFCPDPCRINNGGCNTPCIHTNGTVECKSDVISRTPETPDTGNFPVLVGTTFLHEK